MRLSRLTEWKSTCPPHLHPQSYHNFPRWFRGSWDSSFLILRVVENDFFESVSCFLKSVFIGKTTSGSSAQFTIFNIQKKITLVSRYLTSLGFVRGRTWVVILTYWITHISKQSTGTQWWSNFKKLRLVSKFLLRRVKKLRLVRKLNWVHVVQGCHTARPVA